MRTASELEAIRELAYRLWQARGYRQGHAQEDWLEAEREILSGGMRGNEPARQNGSGLSGEPAETPKVGSRDAPGS